MDSPFKIINTLIFILPNLFFLKKTLDFNKQIKNRDAYVHKISPLSLEIHKILIGIYFKQIYAYPLRMR